MRDETFWVAELVDPQDGSSFAPAVYWSGDTRTGFNPVTTLEIREALAFKDSASCQGMIDLLWGCKRGVLVPREHMMVRAYRENES